MIEVIELEFDDLHVGMEVKDEDGIRGVITEIYDIHNIHIRYLESDEGECDPSTDYGEGLHCLSPQCEEYDPLFKIK